MPQHTENLFRTLEQSGDPVEQARLIATTLEHWKLLSQEGLTEFQTTFLISILFTETGTSLEEAKKAIQQCRAVSLQLEEEFASRGLDLWEFVKEKHLDEVPSAH